VTGGGYLRLERAWRTGDTVELDLPMEVRLIEAHPAVESSRGCVAIERGPLVYCLEQVDQGDAPLAELAIDATAPAAASWEGDILEGVAVVRARGFRVDMAAWQDTLYRPLPPAARPPRGPIDLTAIPYYAWANRAPGAMRVWIPRATA
jgi:DUF1680 family protein